MNNNQISRKWFVIIHRHLTKVSAQIIQCIIFERNEPSITLSTPWYYSAVWCSAADTHLKLLDRVVSGGGFITAGVFECDLALRPSVTVLCILHKFRCNPIRPLYGALRVPYVPVRVTRRAQVAHRYTYEPPRYRTFHNI